MRLSQTLSRLQRIRRQLPRNVPTPSVSDRLTDLPALADNPGQLRGRLYVPETLAKSAGLVVVLHGCTQDAATYDHGSGWSRLADREGFALLFPEQRRSNNMNLCFNWYQPGDVTRGQGEVASMRAMIAFMVDSYALDPARIFVTGLSAGGAMAAALLASYPEVFAGGAIIAGLPVGSGANLSEALASMASPPSRSARSLGDAVRGESQHRGPWPRISVWHGGADRLVVPGNADASVRQWCEVHGLSRKPDLIESVNGFPRRVWLGADGTELVEEYVIAGMAHGTPLMPGREQGQSGVAGAHMLDVGLSSTDRIAAFFGLIGPNSAKAKRSRPARVNGGSRIVGNEPPAISRPNPQPAPANDAQAVIENALRSAGLLR
jgi:poly(hydroxyalkanoate) depolymerase family esterase